MPSFTSRRYIPDRFQSFKPDDDDDMTSDAVCHHAGTGSHKTSGGSPSLVPSDGSLLDYFDLPSPPSTPQLPTHNMSLSSLNSFPSPSTHPELVRSASSSAVSSRTSSPGGSDGSSTPHWPTAAQRVVRLPTRPRSRSVSSTSSTSSTGSGGSSSSAAGDIEMGGTGAAAGPVPVVRTARRTPYYPPNASRNVDRTRVYMNRGPHYIPNWTPLSSLPRHVQLQIEERMVRFAAI